MTPTTTGLTLLIVLLLACVLALGLRLRQSRATLARAAHDTFLAGELFRHTPNAVIILNRRGEIEQVNPAFTRITGYTRAEVAGWQLRRLDSGRQDEEFYNRAWKELRDTGEWCDTVWHRRKDGELCLLSIVIIGIPEQARPLFSNFICVQADITVQRMEQERLQQLALHDALTGLPNRLVLQEELGRRILHAQQFQHRIGVLFVDLDGFKQVNDHHGHAAGDEVLRLVAQRLRAAVRPRDFLARLGGDEFVLLLSGIHEPQQINAVAERVLASINQPMALENGLVVTATLSIGVSIYPDDGGDAAQLIDLADRAMYAAKSSGKDRYRFARQVAGAVPG